MKVRNQKDREVNIVNSATALDQFNKYAQLLLNLQMKNDYYNINNQRWENLWQHKTACNFRNNVEMPCQDWNAV